jgi:hypothetical protein
LIVRPHASGELHHDSKLRAERAASVSRTSAVVDHCSSRTSEGVVRDGDLGVTVAEETTNLKIASTLESLGVAMLRMQERQETSWLVMQERQEILYNDVRADFASKMSANTQDFASKMSANLMRRILILK